MTERLPLKTQMFRFGVSGGIAFIVDFGLLTLFQQVFGLPRSVARSISFIAGTTTAYLINRRWTFRSGASKKRFLQVGLLYALTFAVNVGLQDVCDPLFKGWGWSSFAAMTGAFVISQGVGTTVNFIVQRTVIFRT